MRRNRRRRSFSSKNVKRSKKGAPRSRRISKHHTDQKHSQRLVSGTHTARSRKRKQTRRSPPGRTHEQVIKAVEASSGSSTAAEEDLETGNAPCRSSSLPASKLMSEFEERLRGGHFRFLNQRLYLSSGKDSRKRFKNNESLFREYHLGYLQSMQHWTVQPVDVAIRWLQKQTPHQKVVDYGCGDARIMKTSVSHDVTSLDLVAMDPRVIACDMAHSPLESASHDIAVFSLSLMGTDYHACLSDAARVLKLQGILWIAEVCSRFAATPLGKEDYHAFLDAIEKLGFERLLAKKPSPLFVVFVFKKVKQVDRKMQILWPTLKPCLYKKR